MTFRLPAAVFVGLAVVVMPTVAGAQRKTVDSLLMRVDSLERRAAQLERRVRELEETIKDESSRPRTGVASAKSRDLANWRRLRQGMTMNEVRAVLAEPERVDAGPVTFWYYADNSSVSFLSRSGRTQVIGWSEPSR